MISYEPLFRTLKRKGISSYRLGKMGFPMSNYYAIKRGDNISTHTLNQLCQLLGCRVEDILEYIEQERTADMDDSISAVFYVCAVFPRSHFSCIDNSLPSLYNGMVRFGLRGAAAGGRAALRRSPETSLPRRSFP